MGERRVLLASHGHLASGLKSSLQILTGDASAVTAIDAYVDETTRADHRGFCRVRRRETIVFTDLLGGSVFRSERASGEPPGRHPRHRHEPGRGHRLLAL
ncbi:MAG: PTS sugar transporter subunit IIA [Paratractidigestivibacter faecalis]